MEDGSAPGVNASFEAELDTAFDNIPDTPVEDASVDLAPAETDPPVDEAPPADPAPAEGDEAPAETDPAAEAAPAEEERPEDVRITDRNGKKEYHLPENRYRRFEESHGLRRDLEQRLVPSSADGKAPTIEDLRAAIDHREKVYFGNKEMNLDFLSGDKASQQRFVDHWLQQGQLALKQGDVLSDPVIPLARTFVETLASKHPEAYAELQASAATTLLEDMYSLAETSGNKDLFLSAQHFEKTLFNRYRKQDGQVVQVEPPKKAAPARTAPRTEPETPRTDPREQQFENFRSKTHTDTTSAIRTAAETSLAKIKDAYIKVGLPKTYERIFDGLNSTVHKDLKADVNHQRHIGLLLREAMITSSEQRRGELGAAVVRSHATRAQQIIQKHLPEIVAEATKATKVSFDATHQRRAAAQSQRAPGGGGPAPRTSLIPTQKTDWDPNNFGAEIDRLLP